MTDQTTRASQPSTRGAGGLLMGMIRACRPKQWAKNVLVFVAPAAAGVIDDPQKLLHTFAGFDQVRAWEREYLGEDAMKRYADSVGHLPK